MGTNTHANLVDTERHSPYRQIFANAAARTGDTATYTSDDLFKSAYQVSTSEDYVLTSISPTTWTIVTVSGGGGENLEATLAIGNTMSDDIAFVLGDNNEVSITHLSALDFLSIGGLTAVSAVGTAPSTSGVNIQSRPRTLTDASGSPVSGGVILRSGDTDSTGVGTVGDSGTIEVKSGDSSSSGAGTSGDTGGVEIDTGVSEDGSSGPIEIETGQSSTISGSISIDTGNSSTASTGSIDTATGDGDTGSGVITFITGNPTTGDSGLISFLTGFAIAGDSGAITLSTNDAADSSGNISIVTGDNGTVTSGGISMVTGISAGVRGDIDLDSREISMNTSTLELLSNMTIDSSSADITWDIDGASLTSFVISETTASGSWMIMDTVGSGAGPQLRIGIEDSEIVADSTGATVGSNIQTTIFNNHTNVFIEGTNIRTRIALEHNFELLPQTTVSDAYGFDPYWFVEGTNAGDSNVALSNGRMGLTTNTVGAGDSTVVFAGFRVSKFAVAGSWSGGAGISIGTYLLNSDLTQSRVEFGIRTTHDALDDTTDDEKMILRAIHVGGAANWFLVTSSGGIDTATDTGVAATSTDLIRMVVNSSREVTVIINDIVLLTGAANILANTAIGTPYYAIETSDGSAKSLFVGKFFGAFNN